MKLLSILATLAVLSQGSGLAAEIVTLKSGEIVHGEIVSDTNSVLEIRVPNSTRTIFSLRSIPRSEVLKVQQETVEQRASSQMQDAYRDVQRYQIGTSSYSPEYYDKVITGIFRQFLSNYPGTSNSNEVEAAIREWTEERDKVASGSVKFQGRWYDKESAKTVISQVNATQLMAEGDRLVASGQHEAAVSKYRQALALRPLPPDFVESIWQKLSDAGQRWNLALTDRQPQIAADLGKCEPTLRRLHDQVYESRSQLRIMEERQTDFATAAYNGHHWYTRNGRDLGGVLPTPAQMEGDRKAIASLRNDIKRAERLIQDTEQEKAQLEAEQRNFHSRVYAVDSAMRQLAQDVEVARRAALQYERESKDRSNIELANARLETPSAAVQARAATEPASVQARVETERTAVAEARSTVEKHTVQATDSANTTPASTAKSSWLDRYWGWLVLGVGICLIVLRLLARA